VDATAKAIYPSTAITLDRNIVKVSGIGSNAVQGLYIHLWHPSLVIINNTFEAKYDTRPAVAKYQGGAPASAIFINLVFGETLTKSDVSPTITGNTLEGDVYSSFYFNAYETIEIADKSGVKVLRDDKFAVAETTWALSNAKDQNSVYKNLFNSLKANVKTLGFGYVSIPVKWGSGTSFCVEHYEITNDGAVEAISVYGDHIVNGQYAGNDGKPNVFIGGNDTKGVDYGRKLVTDPTSYTNTSTNKFCYGLSENWDKYDYDSGFNYP
jgi:hypothetical protein